LEAAPESLTRKDYDAWAIERNDKLGGAPVISGECVRCISRWDWERVLIVARKEVEVSDAHREQLDGDTAASGPLRLISLRGVALIHGLRTLNSRGRPSSPQPWPHSGTARLVSG
jgi:hypothetical protein